MISSDNTTINKKTSFNSLLQIINLILRDCLKDSIFASFNAILIEKQAQTPDYLNEKIKEILNEKLFMSLIANFINLYQEELNNTMDTIRMVLIRKIIHAAYKLPEDKLKIFYMSFKKATNNEKSKNRTESFNKNHDLLNKKIDRACSLDISENNLSLNRFTIKDNNSNIENSCSFKKKNNLLKSISYHNSSIGNTFNNTNDIACPFKINHILDSQSSKNKFHYLEFDNSLITDNNNSNKEISDLAKSKRGSICSFNSNKFTFDPLSIEKNTEYIKESLYKENT